MATLRLVPASGNPVEVEQDAALVGRDPGCDVVLADGSVSRRHARIERRGAVWYLVDLGSANGTFVNGARVSEAALSGGAEVRFGALSFNVALGDAELGVTTRSAIPTETVVHASPPRTTVPAPTPARVAPPSPAGRTNGRSLDQPEGPPPARRRGPWLWVGGGCCGCLLVVALIVAGLAFFSYKKSAAGLGVVQRLITGVKQGDQQAAYDCLSRPLKAELSLEQFVDLVNQHPALARNASVRGIGFESSTTSGTQVSVLLVGTSGEEERAVFGLESEDGELRISSIKLEGAAGP
jgi:hypothetical protein